MKKKFSEYESEIERLRKNIRLIKTHKDHIALGAVLSKLEEINKVIREFETVKKTSLYKRLLIKSLKRYREIVNKDAETLKKYGEYNAEHYADRDYYLINKEILKSLEKEAKRLKIKIV